MVMKQGNRITVSLLALLKMATLDGFGAICLLGQASFDIISSIEWLYNVYCILLFYINLIPKL